MQVRQRNPFATVRIEGVILPADLLRRVAENDSTLAGLLAGDYHLAGGEKLNELITRSWNRLRTAWAALQGAVAHLPVDDVGTTPTRERWLLPLFQELGYGRLLPARAIEAGGKSYPISHTWNRVPIHLVGCRIDLDRRTPGVAGAARSSPHSLLQELLNQSDQYLWAFVSNGLTLRVLRDNASLTRQSYVEFDLQSMMEGEAFADFALMWMLCHESRVEAMQPEECWLERWSQTAKEQGTRVLDELRRGVAEAIENLGAGFLDHPGNHSLRERLRDGTLHTQDYYRQVLRMVYRLLFLLVAEERELLVDPQTTMEARSLYTRFYSISHLRHLAERERGTAHSDLFAMLQVVIGQLSSASGCTALGLPALNSFLFSPRATPDLEECSLTNSSLLAVLRALAFTTEGNTRRAVDYCNLGSEELGSVYESLLELQPRVNTEHGTFTLASVIGNERKTSGSFYTPTSLIDVLLTAALDPLLDTACRQADPGASILALRVCDSASGSGHMLIAAAHRMARRLATVRTGDAEPTPEALRAALRDVISHCLYGVDINPMAVELCKVNLWMEAMEPGKPLSFLDSHIKCGNSLVGVAPGLDIREIPDEAFAPVTGDHRPTSSTLKARNRVERAGQLRLDQIGAVAPDDWIRQAAEEMRRLNTMPEDTVEQVQAKEAAYVTSRSTHAFEQRMMEADLWTAAFFWPMKQVLRRAEISAPTQGELARLRRGEVLPPELVHGIHEIAIRLRFFHWPIEFPEVFAQGGFDLDLSNPPWERIKLQEAEFFAERDPEIAAAPNKTERQRLVVALAQHNATLASEFETAKHDADAHSKFIRASGRFPLTAVGDVNTYALFAELNRQLLSQNGRAGIVVPTGIATDDTYKQFFADVSQAQSLVSLYDFENREALFPGVHRSYKFCLLVMSKQPVATSHLAFFATRVEHLHDPRRLFSLSPADVSLFNPNTRTLPIFRTRADADLTRRVYDRVPVFVNERTGGNPWGVSFLRMIDPYGGRWQLLGPEERQRSRETCVPVYEGKMFNQFDHRLARVVLNPANIKRPAQPELITNADKANPSFFATPQYWVKEEAVRATLGDLHWPFNWLLVQKKVTSPINERTHLGSVQK